MDRKLRNLAPQGGSRSDLGVKTRQVRLYTGSTWVFTMCQHGTSSYALATTNVRPRRSTQVTSRTGEARVWSDRPIWSREVRYCGGENTQKIGVL